MQTRSLVAVAGIVSYSKVPCRRSHCSVIWAQARSEVVVGNTDAYWPLLQSVSALHTRSASAAAGTDSNWFGRHAPPMLRHRRLDVAFGGRTSYCVEVHTRTSPQCRLVVVVAARVSYWLTG